MAEASYTWGNFLGGEWSPFAQGRIEHPGYKIALNVLVNMLPMEQGAATRRPARRRLGATAWLASGRLRTFWLPNHSACILELTYTNAQQGSNLRFWTQQYNAGLESDDFQLLCDNYTKIASISTTNPAVVTLASTPPACMNGQPGWQNGDEVLIYIDPSLPLANGPVYCNKQFRIVNVGTNQWALFDVVKQIWFDGGQAGAAIQQLGNSYVGHVAKFAGPWKSLAEVRALKLVQSGASANAAQAPSFLCSGLSTPWALTLISPAPSNAPSPNTPWFTFAAASFVDGPYLDPLSGSSQTGNSTGSIALPDLSGNTLQFTVTDGAYTFPATDVGRAIRLWWQPQQFGAGPLLYPSIPSVGPRDAWPTASRVTYNGSFWMLNVAPNFNPGPPGSVVNGLGGTLDQCWLELPPTAAFWLYGTITAVNGKTCTVTFDSKTAATMQFLISTPGVTPDYPGILAVNGAQIDTWQLGVYTNTQTGALAGGFPTNGFFNDGRLHLLGALTNRGDASAPLGVLVTPPYGIGPNGFQVVQPIGTGSGVAYGLISAQWPDPASPYYIGMTNNIASYSTPCFSPTVLQGGTVLASNGFSYIVDAAEENNFLWGVPYNEGVILGTKGGEFRLVGGSLEAPQPIVPSNVLCRKVTKYGSGPTQPLQIGMAIIFVQALARRVTEYVIDIFSHKFQGRHLNELADHVTIASVDEIAYQEETIPVVWVNNLDGTLASCTYRRYVSGFVQADPQFRGWARHPLPDGRKVVSLTQGANQEGTLDQLVLMTTDGVDL